MKRSMVALSLAVLCLVGLSAEVEFSVRFFDKRIYFPGDPVPIKITIKNDSAQAYRFKLADDKMYSMRIEIRDATNRQLPVSESFIRKQSLNQPVFFRELSLQPGEEYSFIEDAAVFVQIAEPGSYTLSCRFYPELIRAEARSEGLASNSLMLQVRPRSGISPIEEMVKEEARELLKAQKLPPDEVVQRTLEARQKGLWNEFFIYLDLEGLLSRDPARKTAYDRESDEGRRRMVERFRADLMRGTVDQDIITIPYDFSIIDTKYTPSAGQVRVLERFKYPGYLQRSEFTYYLRRSDDIWYIYDYSVTNKGTE